MQQRIRMAGALIFAVLLTGCTYNYDEPRPPVGVSASPEAKMTVKNINATPDGFEVTKPFPTVGPCSYESTSSLIVETQDYSTLAQEYVKGPFLDEVDLKNGALRPNLHYHEDAGVTVIVPDDLFGRMLNGSSESIGMIHVDKATAESLVRDNLRDFEGFLRMVGADDATGFYVAKSSCLNSDRSTDSSEQTSSPEVCPLKLSYGDTPVSVDSPGCIPHVMIGGRPMRSDSLPLTGVCSIEQAKQSAILDVDFRRYFGSGLMGDPISGILIGDGTTVILPAEAFSLLNVLAPEIPNDDRVIYAITPDSHVNLRAALPSLDALMRSTVDQMMSSTDGLEGRTFYLASDKCRPLMDR